jgi:hypothetical protein
MVLSLNQSFGYVSISQMSSVKKEQTKSDDSKAEDEGDYWATILDPKSVLHGLSEPMDEAAIDVLEHIGEYMNKEPFPDDINRGYYDFVITLPIDQSIYPASVTLAFEKLKKRHPQYLTKIDSQRRLPPKKEEDNSGGYEITIRLSLPRSPIVKVENKKKK